MTRLEKLIKNDGTVIDRYGYAEEGVGIFDDDGNRYPAGYAWWSSRRAFGSACTSSR